MKTFEWSKNALYNYLYPFKNTELRLPLFVVWRIVVCSRYCCSYGIWIFNNVGLLRFFSHVELHHSTRLLHVRRQLMMEISFTKPINTYTKRLFVDIKTHIALSLQHFSPKRKKREAKNFFKKLIMTCNFSTTDDYG